MNISPENPINQITQNIGEAFIHVKNAATTAVENISSFVNYIGFKLENLREVSSHKITPPPHSLQGRVDTPKDVIFKDLKELEENTSLSPEQRKIVFYKTCGCDISYERWENGKEIPNSNYKVEGTFYNQQGLRIVILTPLNQGDPPILCCRGTVNQQNVIDDLHLKGIGQYSFEPSMDELKDKIRDLATKFGPVAVTGHSLGGAVAQLITANFANETVDGKNSVIRETYYFNAPGVGRTVATLFKRKLDMCKRNEITPPVVYSARHKDDLVHHAGGKHIRPNERFKLNHGSGVDFLKAHSISSQNGKINMEKGAGVRISHKIISHIANALREGIVGRIANLALMIITTHEDTETKTKRVAEAALQLIPFYRYLNK